MVLAAVWSAAPHTRPPVPLSAAAAVTSAAAADGRGGATGFTRCRHLVPWLRLHAVCGGGHAVQLLVATLRSAMAAASRSWREGGTVVADVDGQGLDQGGGASACLAAGRLSACYVRRRGQWCRQR